MRMFLALVPPDDARDHLDEFLDVRRAAASHRWSLVDQLHVTLGFLPDVPDHALDELVDNLTAAGAKRQAFSTGIRGGGAFPDPAGAKVLWAGLALDPAGQQEIERVAAGARTAATRAGLEVDGTRFRPHVTVARMGQPTEVSRWVRLLDAYEGPTWTADAVHLVASYLGEGPRRRPRYETVATVTLG